MKRQYLGDSKDCFKWDYHHHLVHLLGYAAFTVIWMMTKDDGTAHGSSVPELFPAEHRILAFCHRLRSTRDPVCLKDLPASVGGGYAVSLHGEEFIHQARSSYFRAAPRSSVPSVLLLDPDNGFEPKHASEKHVRYSEVEELLDGIHFESVISVFQCFRRKPLADDFLGIKGGFRGGFSSAIAWNNALMFVTVSRSVAAMSRVCEINRDYAKLRAGVEVLD